MATVGEINIRIDADAIHYDSALTIPEIVLFLDMTKQLILKNILDNDIKENNGTQAS